MNSHLKYNSLLKEKARKLRRSGNLSEVLLWKRLNKKQLLGYDFTRQQIIGDYIVDFYCKKLKLVIKVDGESHRYKGNYDEIRDEYLKSLMLYVLHFKDIDVKQFLNEIILDIEKWIKENSF
ncbi:MAG: endonuclease domain-containing protein [Nitrospirae bacterium]|nr:endonuclease domain-containing protein [Nitrospirota bacterium]